MTSSNFPEHVHVRMSGRADGPMNFIEFEEFDWERRANRAAFLTKHFSLQAVDTVVPKPVNGNVCESAERHNPIYGQILADAVITRKYDLALTLACADAPPLFLYDPISEVIGLARCGWKPLYAGVIGNALGKMKWEYNCESKRMLAFIGPGICEKCYRLGPDAMYRFGKVVAGSAPFNIKKEIVRQLEDLGVASMNISVSDECTACTTIQGENRYHSHRRDRKDPLQANMAVIVMKRT